MARGPSRARDLRRREVHAMSRSFRRPRAARGPAAGGAASRCTEPLRHAVPLGPAAGGSVRSMSRIMQSCRRPIESACPSVAARASPKPVESMLDPPPGGLVGAAPLAWPHGRVAVGPLPLLTRWVQRLTLLAAVYSSVYRV
jgi:hypothetical protein